MLQRYLFPWANRKGMVGPGRMWISTLKTRITSKTTTKTTNNYQQPPTTTNNHQQPPITLNNHKQPQTEWFMPFPSRVLRLILAWVAHIYASAICWRGSVSNASNQASKRHILNNSKQVKLRISKWPELYIMFGAWHKGFRFVNDHYMSNRKNPGNTKYVFDGHWFMEIDGKC